MKQTKEFYFPYYLYIEIFTFDPNHKKNFKPILKDIEEVGSRIRVSYLIKEYQKNHTNYFGLPHMLYNLVPDYEHLFNIVNKCKCCERHQKKRPTNIHKFDLTWNLQPTYQKTDDFYENICLCNCRSLSRDLCRVAKMHKIN